MKISRLWLTKFFDTELPTAEKLAEALTFHVFEIDGIEKVGDDEVLDVKITPNRGHDCLCHRGIAKELSAILNVPFTHDPFDNTSDLSPKTDSISVVVENPELCKRYIAGYIKGVKVGPSPAWLTARLEAIGQRSINNVVDATNFVMFNMGQPLHAFDADKLQEKEGSYAIAVRTARPGEKFTGLDKKDYLLNESMLVIADATADEAIGIAGVKGGLPAGITESTKDIIIESANFDGVIVRKTAQALKLRTDASQRFEQGLSPELAFRGMQGMIEFIQHLVGGEVVGFVDVYPKVQKARSVSVSISQVQYLLGKTFGESEMKDSFSRLGFNFTQKGDEFTVMVPSERLDLQIPEDLVEEIVRIIGYDKVPAIELPSFSKKPEIDKNFYWTEKIREFFISHNFSEIYTSVFSDTGTRGVLNNVTGSKGFLRDSLVPGMREALEKNAPNAELLGLSDICLFEIGTAFEKEKEILMLSIGIVARGKKEKTTEVMLHILHEFAEEIGVATDSFSDSLHSPMITEWGSVKEINLDTLIAQLPQSSAYEKFPLSTATRFKPFSKYPYMVRDISMWIPDTDENIETVLWDICKTYSEGLIRNVIFIDQFKKDNKKSESFRLIFQSFDRTLTESEVNTIMDRIYSALREKGYEIR